MRWDSRNGRQPGNPSLTALTNARRHVSGVIRDGFQVKRAAFDLPARFHVPEGLKLNAP